MNKLFLVFLITGVPFFIKPAMAQESEGFSGMLTLQDAIDTALDRNFDIRIATVEFNQAATNNTAGNAGMLPNVNAGGGVNGSWSNAKIEFATGQIQNQNNASSLGLNGGVQLDWVLFDGMRMFINKRKLEEIQHSGAIELKQAIQNTVVSVIQTYAEVVRQKQQLIALDTALSLAKVRMDIAQKKFEIGSSDKTDYLQAKVDYNASESAYLVQQANLRQAKDSLMILLGKDRFAEFTVQDSLFLNKNLTFKEEDTWIDNNFSMQLAEQDKLLSEYDYKLAKGAQWPTVTLSGAYDFNKTRSSSGYALYNRTYGPQTGLNLSIPVFNGLNIQRQKKIAKQEVFRKDLIAYRLANSLNANYRSAWRAYENALKTLKLEQKNIKYARENVAIQQARFKVGIANTLELREAENSYVAGLSRLVDAAYTVKYYETKLLALENQLVK